MRYGIVAASGLAPMTLNFAKQDKSSESSAGCASQPNRLPTQTAELPPQTCLSEAGVRIVGIRDKEYDLRASWLRSWLPHAPMHQFDHNDSKPLSQAINSFEILILHGKDVERMGHIIKDWRRLLPSKLIIAVLTTMNSDKQNELLYSGADAVLDIDMSDFVAVVWLQSLLSRLSERREANLRPSLDVDVELSDLNVTPMERMILTSLLTKEGTVVNHADILHAIGRDKSKKSLHILSAAVCNLRKKHSALFKIFNIKGLGYGALIRNSDIMRQRQS